MPPEQRYWQNRETANIGLVSSVGRAPERQSAGSSPALVNFSCKIYIKTFPLWFITWYLEKSCIPLWCIPYCLFPGCIVTWVWSLAKGQYMVSWLLTTPPPPKQRYWQNTCRGTANIGIHVVSSVGRALACQYRGRRFKSRSSKFVFVHPKCIFILVCQACVHLLKYHTFILIMIHDNDFSTCTCTYMYVQ